MRTLFSLVAILLLRGTLTSAALSPFPSEYIMGPASKVILVTGGNKGIGHAICRKLLTEYPETFVLLGARDKKRGELAVAELSSLVPEGKDRISLVLMDTSIEESVRSAAIAVKTLLHDRGDERLYGIVNNAGIGWGHSYEKTVATNYFGPKWVNQAFAPFLSTNNPRGRIVNIASASGPIFVSRCQDLELRKTLQEPLSSSIENLDSIAKTYKGKISSDGIDLYGFSKALLNAYTALQAKKYPNLVINSCTPGYIKTDLCPDGTASTEQGASCPVYLLMAKEVESIETGRYYGSDMKRSPLDRYRGPGDPPFEGS